VDQQVQPLQQRCRFLLARPIVRPTPSVRTERAHRRLCQSPLRPNAGGKGSGRLPWAPRWSAVASYPGGRAGIWRRPRRRALPIRDHGGPATYGYLRPPMPPRVFLAAETRHHATSATTAIQTGSTAEHATTPEHPCPGVVARTGPQAVNPSPVSGESMASGGCACGRASHHQPHRGTPATLPSLHRRRPPTRDGPHCSKRPRGAFFPGAAPEPG
jgi:hypothetical protein